MLSKGFGSPDDPKVISHINKGITFALSDTRAMYPYFISPVNGATFPLCPYYSDIFLTLDDLSIFNARKPRLTDSDMMLDSTPKLTPEESFRKQYKFDFVRSYLDSRHTYFDEDFTLFSNSFTHGYYPETSLMDQDFATNRQDFDYDFDNDT